MKLFGRVTRSELEEVKGAIETLGRTSDRYKARLNSHQARLAGVEKRLRNIETYLSSGNEGAMDEELEPDEGDGEDARERALAVIRRR